MRNRSVRSLAMPIGAALVFGVPIHAQSQEGALIEEIVVTARLREESLQDVPVSISVLSADLIAEAGIADAFDLFELTPGITYDERQDRNASMASVRGVQTNAIAPTRQKVNSFLDGMPVLGSQGGLQFVGVERIEIMRGPQSANFGRATFSGAINYISKNPGDEFAADFSLQGTDLGRNSFKTSLSGPITDTLGFTFDMNLDEYDGADEWFSTDGFDMGERETEYYTGKLVFAPNDSFDGSIRFIHSEITDSTNIQYYISGAERDRCTNHILGMGSPYIQGTFNCNVDAPSGGIPLNHRPEVNISQATDPDLFFQAQSFGVLDPKSDVERDRIQLALNFSTDNGSTLQILSFVGEEESERWFDSDASATDPQFGPVMGMGAPMVIGVGSMANPSEIDETYAEVRWLSPADQRLRWLVGASVYDYESLTNVWSQLAGVRLGIEDEANGGNPFSPLLIINDESTATGVFANVTYDVTDQLTLSFEARQQRDEITSSDLQSGATFDNNSDNFQPRLAINYAISDQMSVYGQISRGNNPAGVNLPFVNPDTIASLAAAGAAGFVSFDENTFLTFEEEELTNFEVGLKGSFLDARLQLAAALYVMDWEDMIQPFNTAWNGAWNDGSFDPDGRVFTNPQTMARTFFNTGDGDLSGVEVEASYRFNDAWSIRGAATIAKAEFDSSCDPAAVTNLEFTPTDTIAEGSFSNCVDVSGNDMPGQPDATLALSPTYRSGLIGNSNWSWMGRLDVRWQDSEFFDSVNLLKLPSYTIVNASVAFSNDNWNVRAYVNNITDEDTPNSINFNNDLSLDINGNEENFLIRPRTPREAGFRVNYRF